jgi:hypothetical protein
VLPWAKRFSVLPEWGRSMVLTRTGKAVRPCQPGCEIKNSDRGTK